MSSEVKRYEAVHLRYDDNNIRYGEGCEVEVVLESDYAALEAENARLKREVSHWQGLAVTNRKVADDALAQHQRITSAMTAEVERLKHSQQVLMQSRNAHRDERDALRAQRDAAQDSCAGLQSMVNDLADELAAVKGQGAVAYVTGYYGGRCVVEPANRAAVLPARMALYAIPTASPDVEGLVKALELYLQTISSRDANRDVVSQRRRELASALSNWRQIKE